MTPPGAANQSSAGRVAAFQAQRLRELGVEVSVESVDESELEALGERVAASSLVHAHLGPGAPGQLIRQLARAAPVVVTVHDSRRVRSAVASSFARRDVNAGASANPKARDADLRDAAGRTAWVEPPAALPRGRCSRAALGAELGAASAVIVPSASEARRLIVAHPELARLGREPRVVPHGVVRELPSAPSAPSAARFWSGQRPLRLLHWGGLEQSRGTLDLIEAAGLLPPGSVEVALGGSELSSELVAFAHHTAPHVVLQWVGAVRGESLVEWAEQADLALFPVRSEGYDLAVDEALALGLPTWLAKPSAACARIGASGRILPAGRPSVWARELSSVWADPGALARETRSARSAAQRIRRVADDGISRLESIYRELLARRA